MNRLYEIVKKMPKNEALDFIDRYKDNLKYKNKLEKTRKVKNIEDMKKTVKAIMTRFAYKK